MYRHLRDNHSPSVQTSASSESEIETKGNERTVTKGTEGTVTKGTEGTVTKRIERTAEIPSSPATGGPKRVNSTALCPTVTRLMSMSAVGQSTCKTVTRM